MAVKRLKYISVNKAYEQVEKELKVAYRIKTHPSMLIGFLLKNDMRHDEIRTLRETIDGVIYNNRIAYKKIHLKQAIKGNIITPGLVAPGKEEFNENADFIIFTDENDISYVIYTAEVDNTKGMYMWGEHPLGILATGIENIERRHVLDRFPEKWDE